MSRVCLLAVALAACPAPPDDTGAAETGAPDTGVVDTGDTDTDEPLDPEAGRRQFETHVIEQTVKECVPCHTQYFFGWVGLSGDTDADYKALKSQISLDNPEWSRALAKNVRFAEPMQIDHGAGARINIGNEVWLAYYDWAVIEKALHCPDCGLTAPRPWLAYVEQPAWFWATDEVEGPGQPIRRGARIKLQALATGSLEPTGAPVDFLPDSFCDPDGLCDVADPAASWDGTRLAFSCRRADTEADWPTTPWRVCLAEVGADGRAVNPRELLPDGPGGPVFARTTPWGRLDRGRPLGGADDPNFAVRRHGDRAPTFSPDGTRILFASARPDPDGNDLPTYDGAELATQIVSVNLDGSDARVVFRSNGAAVDHPRFLHSGKLAFRYVTAETEMILQATPDGMAELPVFFGGVQGPGRIASFEQQVNGTVYLETGPKNAAIDTWSVAIADHSLGVGFDIYPTWKPFDDLLAVPDDSRCDVPTDAGCFSPSFKGDPAWFPDGHGVVAWSDEATVVRGGALWRAWEGDLGAMPLPAIGLAQVDQRGNVTPLLAPVDGKVLRYPVWVAPRDVPAPVPDSAPVGYADIRVLDARVWLSFVDARPEKMDAQAELDRIVAVRVLREILDDRACQRDQAAYRDQLPWRGTARATALGPHGAVGHEWLFLGDEAGGDGHGDVPLADDHSVVLRVPAGVPLVFQGVDADGHVVRQSPRALAFPDGHTVTTSVSRQAYYAQCSVCHGDIDGLGYQGIVFSDNIPYEPMPGAVDADALPRPDLRDADPVTLTWLDALRPLVDDACVGCHGGADPDAGLSLAAEADGGNVPGGRFADLVDPAWLARVPASERVPSPAWSPPEALVRAGEPAAYGVHGWGGLGELAAWDPGYRNLLAVDGDDFVYLGRFSPAFGTETGRTSGESLLLETLAGDVHAGLLDDAELRLVSAVVDAGFPYMARCTDKLVPSGPNAGEPWGDGVARDW